MADKFEVMEINKDVYGECPPFLGVGAAKVRRICRNPDQRHEIRLDDLTIQLYLQGGDNGGLVAVNEMGPVPQAIFAFNIFRDLSRIPLDELTPLEILERFTDRFGIEIIVAGKTAKFFLKEVFHAPKDSFCQEVKRYLTPDVHSVVPRIIFTFGSPIAGISEIKIVMAFCINTADYGRWVDGHR